MKLDTSDDLAAADLPPLITNTPLNRRATDSQRSSHRSTPNTRVLGQTRIGDRLDMAPVSVRRPIVHFLLAGLLALIVTLGFSFYASRGIAVKMALSDVRKTTEARSRSLVEPVLTDAVLAGDPAAMKTLDDIVRSKVLDGDLVRVKIWTKDGVIRYSDEKRLIGKHFDLSPSDLALFNGGDPEVEVADLTKPENQYEIQSKLLDAYQAAKTTSGTPVLFEAYFRYSSVTSVTGTLLREFAPIAIGSLVFIELVQIPLAWRLARRLRAGQMHRERLLSHAIESSNAERRRIASDLHDGVVQELTGVSLSLAAAARGSSNAHPQLETSSASIRQSVMALRTLLVDIYPPNLAEEGIESALDDMLRRFEARGVDAVLKVHVDAADLAPGTAGLIYRSAQEALRNVAAHANASSVRVEVGLQGAMATLTVEDNGRGFSEEDRRAKASDDHFGLRALSDLINDAGGRIVVRSQRGVGTHVMVEIPNAMNRRKEDRK
jgi:signal transduction histidine kinase